VGHMKKIYAFVLVSALVVPAVGWAGSNVYVYPIENPYVATVVGTPIGYRAELPEKIRVERLKLTVFKDREVPDVFWYSEQLRYSLAYQKEKAPLIFVIAGTGSGYNEAKMRVLQRAFFQVGFHVIALSSPTHPNFIVSASSSGVPGHLLHDSEDLYRVMELIWGQVQDRIEVSEFYLTGYSLGAAQSAFISKLDEDKRLFNFRKVLLICPPVSLYTSTRILDDMMEKGPGEHPEDIQRFLDRMFAVFSEVYQQGEFVSFTGDFLYAAYKKRQPPDELMAALIGLVFRISSANMVFTSDVMTNGGYIKPKNLVLGTTDSLTDYFKVAARVKFHDYFREFFTPYFKTKQPGVTEDDLIRALSLESIEDYLRDAQKIALVTNEDELILAPGELDYLRKIFGDRAKIYPRGGHCGNLDHRDNVAYMVQLFTD